MNRFSVAVCAMGLALLIVGCSQAPPPAPPDTRAADEKTIRDAEVVWNQDWAAKDPDKIISHYADDATLMIPDVPLMKGKDAMRPVLAQMLADKNASLTFATSSAEVSKAGDLAYTQGTYTLVLTNPKTKKPMTEKGKYVTVYKKQADGTWKAVEDINNEDAPAK
jgi:uncharacterized protein (TIGR02246 family)